MKLHIDKAVYGGAGLARIGMEEGTALAGKTVFTPLTLPGETVEAHITEEKRSFIGAEIDEILRPSLLRTTPRCPYFGVCGGCSYQHAVYAHQLEMKTAILRESLERAHLPDIPLIHQVSGNPWHYRNRIRLHLQASPFALGYRARRSHQLLPVAECPISAPLLEKAIAVVTDVGDTLMLSQLCREIEFFAAEDSLLLSFFTPRPPDQGGSRLATISQELKRALPELRGTSVLMTEGKQPGRAIQSWGETSVGYPTANFNYQVSAGSFFQVNRFLIDALVDLATAERSGRVAWDLYAGVGLFARALTERFERVIAVEPSVSSFADLRHNLLGTSHRAIQAATLDFLEKQKPASTAPELILVDPPRAGLGPAVTAALARIGPEQIVYVSCDPSTLSRDLSALLQSGYDLRTITMVDLFPQTFHLESVAVLTRR